MENIELIDKNSQMLLSEAIRQLIKEILKRDKPISELKQVLMHFFIAISTLEKVVSDEYITNLNLILDSFTKKVPIDKELVEYATSLGKFGQTVRNRKFSVYFCSCIIRIGNNRENDIYKRLLLLCEDSEKSIQFEIAYQIRYFLLENTSEFCIKNFIPIIYNYCKINENDLCFISVLIESILKFNNFDKFKGDTKFEEYLTKKIKEYFSIDDFYSLTNDFDNLVNIFINIMNYLIQSESKKCFIDLLKHFIMKYYIVNEIKNSVNVTLTLKVDYLLSNFDKIISIFLKEKDNNFVNDLLLITMKYYFSNETNLSFLYNKLDLIIQSLQSEMITKNFIHKVFFYFEIEENKIYNSGNNNFVNINPNTCSITLDSSQNDCTNSYICEFKELWMAKIADVTTIAINKQIHDYFSYYIRKIDNICFLIKKTKDYRMQISLIKSLCLIPKYLLDNNIKYPNYIETMKGLFDFCKDFLNTGKSLQIEDEMCQLIVELIKYSKNREDYISYMKSNFLLNKSYFRRRLYVLLCKRSLNTLSLLFVKRTKLYIDLIDNLLIGEIPLIQSLVVELLDKAQIYEKDAVMNIETIIETSLSSKDIELKKKVKIYLEHAYKKENKNESKKEEKERIEDEMRIEEIERIIEENAKKDDLIYIGRSKTKQRSSIACSLNSRKWKLGSTKDVKRFDEIKIAKKPRKGSMNYYFNGSKIIHDGGKEIINTNNITGMCSVIATSASYSFSRIKINNSTNNTNVYSSITGCNTNSNTLKQTFKSSHLKK